MVDAVADVDVAVIVVVIAAVIVDRVETMNATFPEMA